MRSTVIAPSIPAPRASQAALAGLALAALAASPAQAQSNVQIYGLMDVGVEYLSRIEGNQPSVRMPTVTGGQMASRLGFRGTEDLGNGLKAIFVLENGFSPAKGTTQQGGRLFGRQSFLGLSGDWGTVAFGRQYLMSYYVLQGADTIGPAVFGLGSLNAYIPNPRADNTVTYRATFGNWTVGAAYSMGRDGTAPSNCPGENDAGACSAISALLKYDTPSWGLALGHDRLKGGAGAGFYGQPSGLTVTAGSRDTHTMLAGYVKLGDTKLGAGWIHRKIEAAPDGYRSDQTFIAINQPLTQAISIDAIYTRLDAKRDNSDAQLASVRVNYNFSKRTAVYALAGRVLNDSAVGYSVSGGTAAPASPCLLYTSPSPRD